MSRKLNRRWLDLWQWNQNFEIGVSRFTLKFNQSMVLLHKGLGQMQSQA